MGRWSGILIILGFFASPALAQGPIDRPMVGSFPARPPLISNFGPARPLHVGGYHVSGYHAGGYHGGAYATGLIGPGLGVDSLALSMLDGGLAPATTDEASMPAPTVIPGIGGPCIVPRIIEIGHGPRPAVTTRVVYGLPPSCP